MLLVYKIFSGNYVSRPDGTAICWDDDAKIYTVVKFQVEEISPDKVTPEEAKSLLDNMVRKAKPGQR